MNRFKLAHLIFCFSSIITISCPKAAADWFDDFESANIGDTLGSLGYFGSDIFVDAEVSSVGVGGSQGFEITSPQSFNPFYNLFLPSSQSPQPGLQNPGDSLIFQVDMQMQNGSLGGTPSQTIMLDLFLQDTGGGIVSGRIHRDGPSWNQYQTEITALSPIASEFGSLDSVSEIGLINNSAGEWSDWITLQLLVSQTGANSFDLTTNVLDLSGTTLNSAQLVDISDIFANDILIVALVNFPETWEVADRFRFDNIVYSVNSSAVPEPAAATILLFGFLGLSKLRKRST